MNANDQRNEMLNAIGRNSGASAYPTDADNMRIIREAEENLRRQEARRVMDEREVLGIFGCKDASDSIFSTAYTVGFPQPSARVVAGNRFLGTKDTFVISMWRHDYEQWRERFDAVAARMGYVKPPAQKLSAPRVAALGAAVLASLLVG